MELRDVNMLFSNTIIQLGKDLVWKYVREIGEDYTTLCVDLKTKEISRIEFDEDLWRGPSVRLGYINIGDLCVYIARNPVRRYKQGLSRESCEILYGQYRYTRTDQEMIEGVFRTMDLPQIVDCFENKYPTLQECLGKMEREEARYVAFDKQFAVDSDKKVYYKGLLVGTAGPFGITFMQGKEYLSKVCNVNNP